MTAGIFPEDQKACFDAGMNRYVGKPFNLEALVLALKDARPLGPDAASA
jgi:CheY-like chemotaxis protein